MSIYLPDDLYRDARAHELPLSALAQQAIEAALAATRTREWVGRVRNRSPRHRRPVDSAALASALPQHLALPTPAHLDRAFALRERIRVLDGRYVALAEECGCALVTTDRRLAAAHPPCEVHAPPQR